MKYRSVFAILSVLIFGTFVSAQVAPVDASLTKGTLLGPGDEIAGRVVGEPEYEFAATVNEDGKIEVPFSKEPVVAKCKTERELRLELTSLLSKYLKNPQFSFRVTARNSRPPTTISGEVNNPQQVVLMRKVTLLELLTIAGGPKEDSAGGLIQVFRPQAPMCSDGNEDARWKLDASDPTQIPSRTYSLNSVRVGHEESNPIIYPGDVVVVQRAAPVYVMGEVISAQGIYLKESGLSLSEAIAKVGGLRREAKTKDVKIYRVKPGTTQKEVVSANFDLIRQGKQKDLMLQPNDIVEVGVSKPGIGQRILDIAVGAAKTTITAASGALPYRVIY